MAGNKRKEEKFLYLLPKEAIDFIEKSYKIKNNNGLFWEIIFYGGLRISEGLNIIPNDIQSQNNIIMIKTLKQKKEKKDYVLYPKEIVEKLIMYIDKNKISKNKLIFPFSRQWAWKQFKTVLHQMGLSNLYSPHSLRHAHGLAVRDATHDPMAVAKRLRHRSLKNTTFYMHLTEEDNQKIINYLKEIKKNG